ncbi:MAG: hypothetical protein KDK45_24450, partial [Leptospiraceae bacterium]|nr:hypothetical protein [Leptospiraceae bacterium]
KIQFSLFLAEYYLNKNDKDGLANILYIIRTQKDDLKLADTFITANWFLDRNDNNSAKKKLDDYISLENNQYLKTLALAIKQMLLDRSSKKGLQVSDLRCSPKHPYFMLCNIARLRIRLEAVENESSYFERNYLNLDRILAPFFEIPSLSYVYFLDRLVYNLGPRLAYLGFAYEASFFQQSIIFSEKLSSFFNVISYERLAFYQVLSGALLEAESTLNEAIAQLGTKEYLKNSLYLRLGAISYLRKDYSRSLQYYLSLNLKYWGKRMRNPFYDRVLSVNGARDLISVSIWKSKSASQAILALSKIKTGTRLNEDDLFIKLRIAQIMFQDRPEISQKITNEIIYQAQSKGWKRVEYAATILNGFTHIKTNSYRRAVIQFTKSYGILGKSDLKFTSEWLRQQGLYLSKSLRGQRGLFYKNIPHLLSLMHQEEINENVMMLKNYVSSSYNIEGFLNRCIEEYRKKNRIEDIFELIYNYEASKIKTNPIINKGLLQIVA